MIFMLIMLKEVHHVEGDGTAGSVTCVLIPSGVYIQIFKSDNYGSQIALLERNNLENMQRELFKILASSNKWKNE